ncbi:MAG: hypothetical protein QXT94_00470 [Methanothrix sp.]
MDDYGLIAVIIGSIAIIIALATTIFTFGIMNKVDEKREDLNSKVDAIIVKEIDIYKAERPINKTPSLQKISTLEYFRTIALGKAQDNLNFGYLFLIVSLLYVLVILIVGQYVPLPPLTNNNPPLPQTLFLIICEFAFIPPLLAYFKLEIVWKLGRVRTRHYDQRDEDLMAIIQKYFGRRNRVH